MKKKKRIKKSIFGICLCVYVLILLCAVTGLSFVLWNKLSNYQKNIDTETANKEYEIELSRAPQLAFENYINDIGTDDWLKIWKDNYPKSFDKESDIVNYINTTFDASTFNSFKSSLYSPTAPVYLIRNDKEDLAEIYMTGDNLNWNVDHVKLFVSGNSQGSVTAPNGCDVYCNDIMLDQSYITETTIPNELIHYNDKLVNPVSYITYSISGLIANPEFRIDSTRDDRVVTIDENGDFVLSLPEEAGESYVQKANAFIKALLSYYAAGKVNTSENMNVVLSHVPSDSQASKIIRQSYDGVLWRTSDYSITYTTTCSPVYVIADNCYAVDINYQNNKNSEDAECYRVYLIDMGSGFKIYDFGLK